MADSVINIRISTDKKDQLKEASEAAQAGLYFSDRRGSVSAFIRRLIDAFLVAYKDYKDQGKKLERLRYVKITVHFEE